MARMFLLFRNFYSALIHLDVHLASIPTSRLKNLHLEVTFFEPLRSKRIKIHKSQSNSINYNCLSPKTKILLSTKDIHFINQFQNMVI
jgi:hypothetical protein